MATGKKKATERAPVEDPLGEPAPAPGGMHVAEDPYVNPDEENIGGPRNRPKPKKEWVDPMLQFFEFDHLPTTGEHGDLRKASAAFHGMAHELVNQLPSNPERTVALRKLLESKDCAVRSLIQGEVARPGN